MANIMIQKRLFDEYYQGDGDLAPRLYQRHEPYVETTVYVSLTALGMDVNYRKETGRLDLDYGKGVEEWHPRQTLVKKTAFINAEAVRKLFGAKDYSEMIDCIKERFHESTAYDDLLNYLTENGIIGNFD